VQVDRSWSAGHARERYIDDGWDNHGIDIRKCGGRGGNRLSVVCDSGHALRHKQVDTDFAIKVPVENRVRQKNKFMQTGKGRQSLHLGVKVQVVQFVASHDALIQSCSRCNTGIQLRDVHSECGEDRVGATGAVAAAKDVDDGRIAGIGVRAGTVDVGHGQIRGQP